MKIKTKKLSYKEVMALPRPAPLIPRRPHLLFRSLIRLLAQMDLWATRFSFDTHRMDQAGDGPYLILMNHSSFIDLKIASRIFFPLPYCIVCTSDGFVGKSWLMRQIGCIPTQKFVSDLSLIRSMNRMIKEKKTSVLMYPEASYSFDGCATPLPQGLGRLLKQLDVPLVTVLTQGAFSRDPLYNCLQKRKVRVRADVTCLLTREEIREKPVQELDEILNTAFTFDGFAWQRDNGVEINEPFRADGLHRILYKCAHCGAEGSMEGKGIHLTCHECGKTYVMDRLGRLKAMDGDTRFSHIPDWYRWERDCVRQELLDGSYRLDTAVDIGMMVDYKAIYQVGQGRLVHDRDGFVLTGCDGELEYRQKPLASYGLYADYFWYELGDVICIGNRNALYYCFPKGGDAVAKTRLAAEELYKMEKSAPHAAPVTL